MNAGRLWLILIMMKQVSGFSISRIPRSTSHPSFHKVKGGRATVHPQLLHPRVVPHYSHYFLDSRLFSESLKPNLERKRHFGIVGGGLAGLSVAYHLILKSSPSSPIEITILDRSHSPGITGASAVAGGLLHPFSPRGKLLHLGLEGLECANKLIHAANKMSVTNEAEVSAKQTSVVLRENLYRIAMTERNVKELKITCENNPDIATWMSSKDIIDAVHGFDSSNQNILGGVKLEGGCKVVHVPSYLKGLWKACQSLVEDRKCSCIGIHWKKEIIRNDKNEKGKEKNENGMENILDQYDTVILTAGAGLWNDFILDRSSFSMELVRGQTAQLTIPAQSVQEENENESTAYPSEAILSGKYITPIPSSLSTKNSYSMVVGATHEYKETPLSNTEVLEDLKQRSYHLHPRLWDEGKVDYIKSGWRVQSARSVFGRVPIIGRLDMKKQNDSCGEWALNDVWIMSGLSSRGLIYHGVYGDILTDAIMNEDGEKVMVEKHPHVNWWK